MCNMRWQSNYYYCRHWIRMLCQECLSFVAHMYGCKNPSLSCRWQFKHFWSFRQMPAYSDVLYLAKNHAASGIVHLPVFIARITSRNMCSTALAQQGTTIFALSSGHGKCGVAVIRISGPHTQFVVQRIGRFLKLPLARNAVLRHLTDPESGSPIDRGLVLWFPGPQSFTGEDCAEFHVHGGPAVVGALLQTLARFPGCCAAEPGEFAKRAFINGKLDLTEVEGLGDLIHAETEAQMRQALRQMEGDLSKLYTDWRERLIKCVAKIEAFIDFSEDQNIEDDVIETVNTEINVLTRELQSHLNDNRRGERLRGGVHVTILGEPNVGKSSLLNAICQRPAAIVTPIAGTTRDIIETAINLGGYPVLLSDTAGLRETEDLVEKEGIERALKRAKQTDIIVLVLEAKHILQQLSSGKGNFCMSEFVEKHLKDLGLKVGTKSKQEISDDKPDREQHRDQNSSVNSRRNELIARAAYNRTDHECIHSDSYGTVQQHQQDPESFPVNCTTQQDKSEFIPDLIMILNKSDILTDRDKEELRHFLSYASMQTGNLTSLMNENSVCILSCRDGEGFQHFLQVLKDRVESLCTNPLAAVPSLTQVRHRSHLENCVRHLMSYQDKLQEEDYVLAAQALRKALREIGKLTGKITSEDILDVIFRDFCIGK
ncbi:hypothetical protein CHS0354_010472 [Potamilus streckersoni]|uniref:tRNA modification GTPase GTPBP3, mitochondrial n=1 Tax=Potamilus streckersoni TaxID=2493646 RepID=A0AAE0RRL6_9BIVA|nr:hypothetical protein CHS0354_010472 [Potamilus streckersoni]